MTRPSSSSDEWTPPAGATAQPPPEDPTCPELVWPPPVVPPVALVPPEVGGTEVSLPSWPEVVVPPVPTSTVPRVGAPAPNGPTQIFVCARPASRPSAGGVEDASAGTAMGWLAPASGVGVPIDVQVHPLGHSPSLEQVVAFGVQEPGYDVLIGHCGAPPSAAGGDEAPLPVAPPLPLGADEPLRVDVPQPPDTVG